MEEKFEKVIELFKSETEKECYQVLLVDGEPSIMEDKIGGKPYLPVGEEYPEDENGEPLALLLQVNLSNIELKGYPKKGILEIFTDKDVEWPCQYVVKYFEDGLDYQTELPDVDLRNYIVQKSYKIDLTKSKSYMSTNDYRFISVFSNIVNKVFDENISNFGQLDDFFGSFSWFDKMLSACANPFITLGGYPDFTQSDPRGDMDANKDECLFKLDSSADYKNFSIGDSGIIFTLISQEDIENCNFENAFVDWDCC